MSCTLTFSFFAGVRHEERAVFHAGGCKETWGYLMTWRDELLDAIASIAPCLHVCDFHMPAIFTVSCLCVGDLRFEFITYLF
jgi:hypothetical protein